MASQRVDKDYGWIDKGGIRSLYATNDGRWLFVGASDGCLLQFCLGTRKMCKDYGRVLDTNIYTMVGSDGYCFLWIADESGLMKVLDIEEQSFVKQYIISSKAVYCMCMVRW